MSKRRMQADYELARRAKIQEVLDLFAANAPDGLADKFHLEITPDGATIRQKLAENLTPIYTLKGVDADQEV